MSEKPRFIVVGPRQRVKAYSILKDEIVELETDDRCQPILPDDWPAFDALTLIRESSRG